MNLTNVTLILSREIRDQLRDRRTLFMMFVLPILLYPLLGMSFFQASQFMREQATSVLVLGAKHLPDRPPLFENRRFAGDLFSRPDKARLLELHFARDEPSADAPTATDPRAEARRSVQAGEFDAAIYFPAEFADRLRALGPSAEPLEALTCQIFFSTANEKSQIARVRLVDVLNRWTDKVGGSILETLEVPASAAKPVLLDQSDVAEKTAYRGAALWSKVLPVLLLVWALTGAFYPAVDLCAGEKERGTLETLLSSPAERSEIVLGKLLTIMLFSMITAVLNLASIALTGWLVLGHLPEFGPPPPMAPVWLAIALVPVSALFSALCLALAVFARSSKEGQYYLMPLLLVTMPLAVLPMAPGVELTLGNSLIPVSGVVLLLRSLLEGHYWQALQFLPAVVAVTLAACMLAVRWAVDQFNSESVLFRESERLEMGLWLRHLVRDRRPTPTVAGALSCAAVILIVRFYLGSAMKPPGDFGGFVRSTLVMQLAVIATPALMMTIMLTSSPRRTLLLGRPSWPTILGAAALAVVLHPVINALQVAVQQLYPIGEDAGPALTRLQEMINSAPLWQVVLVIALVPAICEELAFRGFILSGFRHLGHKWRAIMYSAVLFGLTHLILQQSLVACVLGIVIGYLVVQSGSLWPAMIFHLVHNTLAVSALRIPPELLDRWPVLGRLMSPVEGGYAYPWPTVIAGSFLAVLLLYCFSRLAYPKSAEEELQEAIDRGSSDDEDEPLAAACGRSRLGR